jgi:2-aminophenol/2-amino-5-chlorophenol 1,6-dioxygenase alpha subunit
VLDELWQTRPHLKGVHVDENWYEFGDLAFDMRIDTELAHACIAGTRTVGVSSKAVNYDGFPIDTGTIAACRFLNEDGRIPLVIAANNLYHDWATTERLGRLAAAKADELGRKVAVVGVGGLSGRLLRERIDIRQDRIAEDADDRWNREMLDLMERGDVAALRQRAPAFAKEAHADMGFKHMAWLLGALDGKLWGARVHAYGPAWGSGAAVVEFRL